MLVLAANLADAVSEFFWPGEPGSCCAGGAPGKRPTSSCLCGAAACAHRAKGSSNERCNDRDRERIEPSCWCGGGKACCCVGWGVAGRGCCCNEISCDDEADKEDDVPGGAYAPSAWCGTCAPCTPFPSCAFPAGGSSCRGGPACRADIFRKCDYGKGHLRFVPNCLLP